MNSFSTKNTNHDLNRDIGLDAIKFIAMIGVIALHTIDLNDSGSIGFIIRESAVVSVPLFFMVSGFLLLGRKNSNYNYPKKKIKGILRCEFILCLVYWMASSIFHNNFFNLYNLIHSILGGYIQQGPFWMFWYLGATIIIYMLYPILNYFFLEKPKILRNFTILLLILCTTAFVGNIHSGNNGIYSELNIPQTFRLHTWFLYFCLGGEIKIFITKKLQWYWLVLALITNILIQYILFPHLSGVMVFYSSPIGIITTVICFIWIYQRQQYFNNKIIRNSSKVFLPVYILHPYIITVAERLFSSTKLLLGTYYYLIMWSSITILPIVIAMQIMKIKYVNSIFKI